MSASDPRRRALGPIDAFFEADCFRTPDGRRLVHPWGGRSRGYEIPSEELYQRLRRDLRWSGLLAWVATPLLAALTVDAWGPLPAVAFAAACGLGSLARIHVRLRGLPRTGEPYPPEAARLRRYRALQWKHLWAIEGGLLAATSLALAWHRLGESPLAAPTALGCALLALCWSGTLRRKWRSERAG